MAKKAYLVTYEITTRVIVDDNIDMSMGNKTDNDDENLLYEAHKVASSKIASDPEGYLVMDNVTDFVEDTEMPYGEDEEDR